MFLETYNFVAVIYTTFIENRTIDGYTYPRQKECVLFRKEFKQMLTKRDSLVLRHLSECY
jgi:hypothetical protein